MLTLTDGSQIEFRAFFSISRHVFMKMKQEDRDTLRRERAAYQETRRSRNEIQELRTQVQELGGTVSISNSTPPDSVSLFQRLQVSQLTTTNHSIM
jgi:hypothetical protein